VERDQWIDDVDDEERMRFDEVLEQALTELEPVCLAEQNFCVAFFKLDVFSPTTKVPTCFKSITNHFRFLSLWK